MWKCIYCGAKLSSCKLFTVNFFRAKMFNWKWRRCFSFESLFPMGLCFWKRYQLCSHPSEILVSELRSKSEWERFPPALKISSFQREYLKIPTWWHSVYMVVPIRVVWLGKINHLLVGAGQPLLITLPRAPRVSWRRKSFTFREKNNLLQGHQEIPGKLSIALPCNARAVFTVHYKGDQIHPYLLAEYLPLKF